MKGVYVRQLIPSQKRKQDVLFVPEKRSKVSKVDPRWTKGDQYYVLSERHCERHGSSSTGNFAYSCIEYPLVSAGTKGSYLGPMSRFLHVNFGISGSILSGVALHTMRYKVMDNWYLTYSLSAGICCTFSYLLEYINRHSYNIKTTTGERKDNLDEDEDEFIKDEDEYSNLYDNLDKKEKQTRNEQSILIGDKHEVIPVESDNEVADDWRTALFFKDTALAALPLRAIVLLKADGWNDQNIRDTWPHGASKKLIDSLLETGVEISFNAQQEQVRIQRIEPHWFQRLPEKMKKTFINHGWSAEHIAYKRPQRLPKYLKQFAYQYGYSICEHNGFIATMETEPDWYVRLPTGLKTALETSGWDYKKILNGRCTDMESGLLCLIADYGVEISFDEDGIIQVSSRIPDWWSNLPHEVAEWSLTNSVNFHNITATRLEILKHVTTYWTEPFKLEAIPRPFRKEYDKFYDLKVLVDSHLKKVKQDQEESDDRANCEILARYPQMSDMPPFTKITDPAWWRNIPVEIRREIIKSKVTPEMIEQGGIKQLGVHITDLFIRYEVMVRDEMDSTHHRCISVEHVPPKWWQKVQNEIKVCILNKGHGWHDLFPHEVSAIRAATKLYWLPYKLNAWLAKAPQVHAVTLSKFGILNLLMLRYQEQADKVALGVGDKGSKQLKANIPIPSAKPVPLALVDQTGRTVNFCPITVWSGDRVNPDSWSIQNLRAERVLLTDQKERVLEEIEEWIDIKDINKLGIYIKFSQINN